MNNVKTMLEATNVGEGVSYVKSSIRGICAAIFHIVMLRLRCDALCDQCFGREKL